jgi:hypothetical protein
VVRTYRVFSCHRLQSSQVPYLSRDQLHAAYTPDTAWPIDRLPPCCSWESSAPPVLMSLISLSMRNQRFTCVRLSDPHMTCLTTPFNRHVHHRALSVQSSCRLFEARSCKPTSEDLPPSQGQHGALTKRLLGTTPPRLLTEAAYGSLKPPPTGRLRRVLLHLSHSMTLARLLDTTPQSGFSMLIRQINARSSVSICGRLPCGRDFQRQ